MNAATVFRILSLIPDRTPRALSGSLFVPPSGADGALLDADRVAYVARFLHWLSPLNPITREDQRALGLLAPHARPDQGGDEDAEEAADDLGEDTLAPEEAGMDLARPADTQQARRLA